jgi:hypothetical protein
VARAAPLASCGPICGPHSRGEQRPRLIQRRPLPSCRSRSQAIRLRLRKPSPSTTLRSTAP